MGRSTSPIKSFIRCSQFLTHVTAFNTYMSLKPTVGLGCNSMVEHLPRCIGFDPQPQTKQKLIVASGN